VVGLFLNGKEFPYRSVRGGQIVDGSFLMLINAHHEDVTFALPARRWGQAWALELSTADPTAAAGSTTYDARGRIDTTARSVTVLKRVDVEG
ncbi:MAG: isoamylase, partial [Solirubrobacteraceae bacterium]|nr:isoamylase [Solirubrobacteraceae bacterium]